MKTLDEPKKSTRSNNTSGLHEVKLRQVEPRSSVDIMISALRPKLMYALHYERETGLSESQVAMVAAKGIGSRLTYPELKKVLVKAGWHLREDRKWSNSAIVEEFHNSVKI